MSKLHKLQISKNADEITVYARGTNREYKNITLSSLNRLSNLTYRFRSQMHISMFDFHVFIWRKSIKMNN